jgi:hypothetical protein
MRKGIQHDRVLAFGTHPADEAAPPNFVAIDIEQFMAFAARTHQEAMDKRRQSLKQIFEEIEARNSQTQVNS